MASISDIIGPIYQELSLACDAKRIMLNLDIDNPNLEISDESANFLNSFLLTQIDFAGHRCDEGDTITIHANGANIAVKNSGEALSASEKSQLQELGYEVYSRYGYGTSVGYEIVD